MQFPPGTWTGQAVTVSHLGVRDIPIINGGASGAFVGLDPAGQWKVVWGGNLTIHPIGIELIVETK